MLTILMGFMLASPSQASAKVYCSYAYFSAPFAQVNILRNEDGTLGDVAEITMSGSTHSETLTPVPLAAGEIIHAWISKENPENAIEMFIYAQAKPQGQSKIVNEKMPMGKDIWGNCTGL